MIKIFNSLTKKKEILKPLKNKRINFFVCGPTVYEKSHLGHARTYIAFDAIVKYLRYKGYKVTYILNITDIEDKIFLRAGKKRINPLKLARSVEKEFIKEMRLLGINSVSSYPRASDYIPQIINQIKVLLKKGFAYITSDGVYYDIAKFPNYGKLSNQKLDKLKKDSRKKMSGSKRNFHDFALWKKKKTGEPFWKSPWGEGRPGWHIEDTAITNHYFGSRYDIHGGGADLIFPHHEAEIAQMEAASGKSPLVKIWMHTGMLNVKGKKMSKSLNNFVTVQGLLRDYRKEIIRLAVLSNHYRSRINFIEKDLYEKKAAIESVSLLLDKLRHIKKEGAAEKKTASMLQNAKRKFAAFMDDDFNTPKATAVVFSVVKKTNKLIGANKINSTDAKDIIKFIDEINKVLGIIYVKSEEKIPDKIKKIAEKRDTLRKEKNWKESDLLRDKAYKLGYVLEDTPQGTKITKK